MDINELKTKAKREFDKAISLMSIIPFLTLFYLLVGKIASLKVLTGETGYIMLVTTSLIILGIISGKKLIWMLISRILDFSQRIVAMEKELIEKNRLAAISETVLSLSHEINNPLLIMQGNLSLLEEALKENNLPEQLQNRVSQVKNNCERIMQVTYKMSELSASSTLPVHEEIKMINMGNL
jgi:signal transduction histidine kinase